jgi:hypothetical protein
MPDTTRAPSSDPAPATADHTSKSTHERDEYWRSKEQFKKFRALPPPPPQGTAALQSAVKARMIAQANNRVLQNSKQRSEYFDPCQETAERSIRCLNRNRGDRDMCKDYFQ